VHTSLLPRDAGLRKQCLKFMFNSVPDNYNTNLAVCCTYGRQLPEPTRVQCWIYTKAIIERWSSSHFKSRSCCLWAPTYKYVLFFYKVLYFLGRKQKPTWFGFASQLAKFYFILLQQTPTNTNKLLCNHTSELLLVFVGLSVISVQH